MIMKDSRNKLIDGFTVVGGFMVLAGAALKITSIEWASMIFLAGSTFFAVAILSDRYRGEDKVMRRLSNQQAVGALLLLLTALLMFADSFHARLIDGEYRIGGKLRTLLIAVTRRNGWIVTMTLSAVFLIFSVFRMEQRQQRTDAEKNGDDLA